MGDGLSRRNFLRIAAVGVTGTATAGLAGVSFFGRRARGLLQGSPPVPTGHGGHGGYGDNGPPSAKHEGLIMPGANGDVDHAANGFNPSQILTDFDYGRVSRLPGGQTLREYNVLASVKAIEVLPGIRYEAWTYNGRVPGPTFRCSEGDRIRITFANGTGHPHTMHFHGIHPGKMDGVFEQVPPGGKFVYEFDAGPFGLHQYHCHMFPLAEHITRGLYGAFIIDPKGGRPKVDHEFVLVMTGVDLDFDGANDAYAVNFIPFHYDRHPIKLKVGEKVRIYLVNLLEYDPTNSFHLHANFFHYYPTGTSLTPSEYTDTIAQMQAQRGIVEFAYQFPGRYMFHGHKTEFAELGWTGVFEVEA
jgi:FtsP/CotA-like multicopper oxidase with cupredoxin domain